MLEASWGWFEQCRRVGFTNLEQGRFSTGAAGAGRPAGRQQEGVAVACSECSASSSAPAKWSRSTRDGSATRSSRRCAPPRPTSARSPRSTPWSRRSAPRSTSGSSSSSPTSRTSRTSSRNTWCAAATTRSPRATSCTAPSAPACESRSAPRRSPRPTSASSPSPLPKGARRCSTSAASRRWSASPLTGLEIDVPADVVAKEVAKSVYDGIPTEEIGRALVMAASTFIERDPAYSYVSARLLLRRLYRETFGLSTLDGEGEALYRIAFVDGIHSGVAGKLFDPRLAEFDLDLLSQEPASGTRPGVPVPRPPDARRALPGAPRRAPTRAAAGFLDARRDGPGGGRSGSQRPGARVLRADVDAALRAVDTDSVPRRHHSPAALVLLPHHGRRRPGPHLQEPRRQRPALQVVGRAGQRLVQHPRHQLADQEHQRREPGRDPVPQDRQRRHHGDQPFRQAARRHLRLPRDLAHGHRGLPRPAPQHRRRATAHPRHEHRQLDSRPVPEAGRGGRHLDAVFAQRGPRPPPRLRRRLRDAATRPTRRRRRAASWRSTRWSRPRSCGERC